MSSDFRKYSMPGQCQHEGIIYPDGFFNHEVKEKVKEWKGHPQDIILAAYPKTGITWASSILSLILNDADQEKTSAEGCVQSQIEYLERCLPHKPCAVDTLKKQDPPRVYKTHLPYKYVKRVVEEDKSKVIFLVRNPKDTLVSLYHFYRMNVTFGHFPGSFHDFFELYRVNRLIFGNIIEWFNGWWECINLDNVLVVEYEEMLKRPHQMVEKITAFVGKTLTETQIADIVSACAFNKMSKNPLTSVDSVPLFDQSVSKFYRKGIAGDWKNHFTEEESKLVDDQCKEYLEPKGFFFTYE